MKLVILCFADDLMIFSKGHAPTIQIIMEALQQFSTTIGLSVNIQKFEVYMAGINEETQQKIIQLTSFSLGSLL